MKILIQHNYTSTLLKLLTYSQRMSPVQCLVLLCCYFGQLFPQLVYGRFIVAGQFTYPTNNKLIQTNQ